MKPTKEELEALKTLNKLGYQVKLNRPTTKKTFEVDVDTLAEFMSLIESNELKVKEAIHDALSDWIAKKRVRRK